MNNEIFSPESRCRRNQIHDWKQIEDNEKYVVEFCIICGNKEAWNKAGNGRINNELYRKSHERDFAQPYGRTRRQFLELYGPVKYNELVEKATTQKKDMKAVWEEAKNEAAKELRRNATHFV